MRLFTKLTIILFSLIGTSFFGALLFSDNLKQVEKSKFIAPTIIFGMLWTVVINRVIAPIPIPFLSFAITNLIGGLILAGPMWNHYIDKDLDFVKRPIWGPLLSLVVLAGAILTMLYWAGYRVR
jgi:hypothetical protein